MSIYDHVERISDSGENSHHTDQHIIVSNVYAEMHLSVGFCDASHHTMMKNTDVSASCMVLYTLVGRDDPQCGTQ